MNTNVDYHIYLEDNEDYQEKRYYHTRLPLVPDRLTYLGPASLPKGFFLDKWPTTHFKHKPKIEKPIDAFTNYLLDHLSDRFNRRKDQALFMFKLCNKSIEKYCKLEHIIKNNHVCYVPGNNDEVEKLMKLGPNVKEGWFNLHG